LEGAGNAFATQEVARAPAQDLLNNLRTVNAEMTGNVWPKSISCSFLVSSKSHYHFNSHTKFTLCTFRFFFLGGEEDFW